jgi:hypothetical protein
MSLPNFLAFLCLALSLLSPWLSKSPKLWGGFLVLALGLGELGGILTPAALLVSAAWAILWVIYVHHKRSLLNTLIFSLITLLSFGFKFHLFPGFDPFSLTPKFAIGFTTPLLGIFSLALFVPLARSFKEWGHVFTGLIWGILGIAALALIAVATGAVHWQYKMPSFALSRYFNNFIFVSIPEEAFYRGFLQHELTHYLSHKKGGGWLALFLTSLIFTLAHVYWSPTLDILAFVFLASLLYGWVYMKSGKIESAILCHFLLNFVHMTFFSYHAL